MDFESAILHDLQTRVVAKAAALYRACAAAAELDCLVSLAAVAKLHNYCRPVLSDDDPQLHITNGRHPLMEAAMDVFVPNDTHCERTVGRINVITGPNYSGKSVYLKQVWCYSTRAHRLPLRSPVMRATCVRWMKLQLETRTAPRGPHRPALQSSVTWSPARNEPCKLHYLPCSELAHNNLHLSTRDCW